MSASIHQLASVASSKVGDATRIWQYTVVLEGAVIGRDCDICSHCRIENDVIVGDHVTLKSGVQLWDGVRLEDDVFVGPNASFVMEKANAEHSGSPQIVVERGASIGAGAVLFPGVRIGHNAMIGAGAVVSRSVPPNAIVAGNPAKIVGYVDAKPEVEISHTVPELPVVAVGIGGVTLHRLPRVTDIRGSLTVGEFTRSIPFEAKRYFMVFDVPSMETRGEHAHRACHQFLICVRGSCAVVADDGHARREIVLDRPDMGIHLPPMVWGIQYKYSADAMLLVFASHFYDNADYIRDYAEFRRLAGAQR